LNRIILEPERAVPVEPDKPRARLLVAIGSSPNSEYLVRKTRDLAEALRATWVALHVDTGVVRRAVDAQRIEARLAQARALGGETIVISDVDVAERIIAEARERRCTMIVVGRSGLSTMGFLPRISTISDKISRLSGPIDVVIAQDDKARRGDITLPRLRALFEAPRMQVTLLFASFAILLAIGYPLSRLIGYRSVALVYLAAVICLSLIAKPAIVALLAVASASALNYFMIPPYFTFRISLVEDSILFAVYFLAAFVTSTLVATVRSNGRMLRDKERRTSFLFESLQKLASCRSVEEAAFAAAGIAASYCGRGVIVYVVGVDGRMLPEPFCSIDEEPHAGPEERAAAQACSSGGPEPSSLTERYLFIPVTTGSMGLGAIGIGRGQHWSKADTELVKALGRALALVVDRENGEAMNRTAVLAVESERLSRVLLDTVSHELRTPLTAVTGAISALCDDSLAENPVARKGMLDGALSSADRLNAVVDDLLSASRIGSGMLRLKVETVDLAEIASAAASMAAGDTAGRKLVVEVDDDADPARVDLGLVARMTANLLRNASRYSSVGGTIRLSITESYGTLRVEVSDDGPGMRLEPGVPPFRKFSRGHGAAGGGLGLGLVICEGIAAAHGGTLCIVDNRADRFAIAAELPAHAAEGIAP